MTTVTWVQNGNGEYEISSSEHLKQLMNKGGLYTDAGTPPSSYWGSGTNYIQTVDIDLLNDSTDIKPIGTSTDNCYLSYDGSEYAISNYSYLDPNFNTTNECETYTGLFGAWRGEYLKNIRLTGVWTMRGFQIRVGFLAGWVFNTTFNQQGIWNIEADFAPGTLFDTNAESTAATIGPMVGFCFAPYIVGITVKGTIDFQQDPGATQAVGGVFGYCQGRVETKLIRNLATFPSGIRGLTVGGVIGQAFGFTNLLLNSMVGDIEGATYTIFPENDRRVGGICGWYRVAGTIDNFVNCMTGNISNGDKTGGIIGVLESETSCNGLLNYMTGNISPTSGQTDIGGLIGEAQVQNSYTITNCINAMNGSVSKGLIGSASNSSNITNNIVDFSFGLTSSSNSFNGGTPSGLLTNTEFTDLPYFDLTGTDVEGGSYDFEFIYGNLSGNSSYSAYTHLVLHRKDICSPYEVIYGLSETNTTVYLTYVNTQNLTIHVPAGLSGSTTITGVTILLPPLLTVTARSINIIAVMSAVTGAIAYRLTVEGPTGGEVTKVSGTTVLEQNIVGIEPETQYTVRMYANTGSGYELSEEIVVTTLINDATSYEVTDFDIDGLVTIDSLGQQLNVVINELFNTGDILGVSLNSNENVKSTFIKNGETLSIKNVTSTLIPFTTFSGTGQNVTFILSDDVTTVPITYDETLDNITVNSVSYNIGDSFILDGKKVTTYDI